MDGGSEIDAEKALSQLVRTVDDLLQSSESIPGKITHVAAACFWHSLVGLDRDGKPTTKVLSWADNRSRDFVPVLRKKFNESEVHNRTGARFHSSFWPAKLLWLRKAQPEAFTQTAQWLSLSDYLSLR
nr:FGGY family of carbohydrate kinases, N-terminal domain protein [uncultured bacterium]